MTNVDFTQCDGSRDPNGVDFWWDEEEGQDCVEEQPGCVDNDSLNGNCWDGNRGFDGNPYSSDPPALLLPNCPGLDAFRSGQLREAGDARAVRDLEPDGQHRPARVRLVHPPARAVRPSRPA